MVVAKSRSLSPKKPASKKLSPKKSTAKKKAKLGRPAIFTPALEDKILKALSENPHKGIRTLCKENDHFPDCGTVYMHRVKSTIFNERCRNVMKIRAELAVEDLSESKKELLYYFDSEGNKRIDSPSATLVNLDMQNKKWFASKLAPKLYGNEKEFIETKSENESLKKELQTLRKQLQEQNESEY